MNNEHLPFIKDYSVFNSNFREDVVTILNLNCSAIEALKQIDDVNRKNPPKPNEIKAGQLSLKERLNALIDRIEFIKHLDVVSKLAVISKFRLLGQEVEGIHWDIKALRLYLALTCVDIFYTGTNHGSHFEKAFSQMSGSIKKKLTEDIRLYKSDETLGNLEEIGLFLYNVRCYYTHSGKRFHIVENLDFAQQQSFLSGHMSSKERQTLLIASNINLVDLVLDIAKSLAKRDFGWESE